MMQALSIEAGRATLRGPVGFAAVAAFHAALIVFVAGALQLRIPVPVVESFDVRLFEGKTEPPPAPPPVRPHPLPVPVEPIEHLPRPFDFGSDDAITTAAPPDETSANDTGSAAIDLPFIPARVDPRRPLSQPEYPPSERRLGREGSVELELLVLPDGRVGEARVVRSSGSEALDEAARREAQRRWRLLPARRGDVAVESRHRMRVSFRLTDSG